jgi:hypothetical protein
MFNNQRPMAIGEFAELLSRAGHVLVLPFSLISELIPADNNPIVVLRRFTKIEEDVPHIFLQQEGLPNTEIRNAADDFAAGRALTPHDPFVNSFIDLWGRHFQQDPIFLMDVDRTIGTRKMSRQIELSLQRAEIFHWHQGEAARAVAILRNEQQAIIRDKPQVMFRNTVARWLRRADADLPEPHLTSFAAMLRTSPRVAPGWRLFIEVFAQIARDKSYKPSVNDVWDLAHITMLPYLDAATLDKNKVEIVRQVTNRLRTFDPALDYSHRIYADIRHLIKAISSRR